LPAIALSPACGGSRAPHAVHIRAAAHPPASLRAAVVAANLLAAFLGNAPNFMVYATAEQRGVKMPSFFGYMLWSFAVLLPVLGLLTWLSVWQP
jgi:Na+/H+ antiporter NhaD/arsenite permease-like protein